MPLGAFRINSLSKFTVSGPDYTVPTSAFVDDANTEILLKFENNATDTTGNYSFTNTNMAYNSTTKQFGSYSAYSEGSNVVREIRSTTNAPGITAQDCTIEGWIYSTSYSNQEHTYGSGVPKGLGLVSGTDWGWSFGISNGGYLRTFWFQSGYKAITSTEQVPLNQWNHVVLQHTTSDNLTKLGLNGYWIAEATTMTGTIGSNRFCVGTAGRAPVPDNYWDEVRYSTTIRY